MGSVIGDENQDLNQTLLSQVSPKDEEDTNNEDNNLVSRVWIESKKLWIIVGPAIFSRVASFTMNVITQAFAGHLGDVELAAISIANTVIVGFNFGLLVRNKSNPTPFLLCLCFSVFLFYILFSFKHKIQNK